jgi:hypothetical protein
MGEKLHYNAYEMGVFWRNCIIMQFWGMGKNKRKCVLNAVPNPEVSGSGAEYAEKDFGVSGAKVLAAGVKVAGRIRFSAKPLISTHLTRDRRKSFISNTYITRVGVGGCSNFLKS